MIGKNDMDAFPVYLRLETSDIHPDRSGQQCLLKNVLHARKYQDSESRAAF